MAKPWYQYPFDNPAGAIEPYGGGPKPDSNVQCPPGTPITALLSGTISGLNAPDGSVPAWGAVVTIRLDTPVNKIATHTAYLHLEPLPANLRVGMHVSAGQVIGWSGGPGAQGAQKVPVGFALYNGDYYGFGPTWNQYVGNAALNPYGTLLAASSGKLNMSGSSSSSSGSSGGTFSETGFGVKNIAPNADVKVFLYVLDQLLALQNPFDISNATQDTINWPGGGFSFTDPVSWMQQFGVNVMDDIDALTIRMIFLVIGIFIMWKIISAFIDFGQVGQFVGGVARAAVGTAVV